MSTALCPVKFLCVPLCGSPFSNLKNFVKIIAEFLADYPPGKAPPSRGRSVLKKEEKKGNFFC